MLRTMRNCALAAIVGALTSCGTTPNRAPVESVPVGAQAPGRHGTLLAGNHPESSASHYRVVKGDTL
jgi:hypothetical protein